MNLNLFSLILSLSVVSPLRVLAVEVKGDNIQDQYILEALDKVSESNLDNVLEVSRANALKSAENLRGIMMATRADVAGLFSEIERELGRPQDPQPGTLEESIDGLLLSAQMIPAKSIVFAKKSRLADMRLSPAKADMILGAGRSYRNADRTRDLHRAEQYLHKAVRRLKRKESPALNAAQAAAVSAAAEFKTELESSRDTARAIRKSLLERGDRPGLVSRLDFWGNILDTDLANINNERRILEIQFSLMRCDEEDF